MITRRMFSKLFGVGMLALATGASLLTGSCGFVDDLLGVLPSILRALDSILSMIKGAGVILGNNVLAIIGTITSVAADLIAALKDYKNKVPGSTLDNIDALLGDLLADFQNLISLLPPLPGIIVALVLTGLQIILGTIEGFVNQMPAASLPKSRAKLLLLRGATFQGRQLAVTPIVNPNNRKFRSSWNAIPNLPAKYKV